uniref:LITAF domain-containing protein n=1 Tax=Acrobeloides nanus TaxID=290746 RepID=A0A914BXA0_9BILA
MDTINDKPVNWSTTPNDGQALPHDTPVPPMPPPQYQPYPNNPNPAGFHTQVTTGYAVNYTANSYPQPQSTIVITGPPRIDDDHPTGMMCPYCQRQIMTKVSTTPSSTAWMIFIICFITGFFFLIPWCLCWIPFVMTSCMNIEHRCPNCNRCVGRLVR